MLIKENHTVEKCEINEKTFSEFEKG